MSDQNTFERAVMLYRTHCEKSGESFQLPDSGRFIALPSGGTAWALIDDEQLIATVWDDDGTVTTDATAHIVELEELFSL